MQRGLVRRLLDRQWRVVDQQVLHAQARCCFDGSESATERAIRKQKLKWLKAQLTTIEGSIKAMKDNHAA